VIRAFSANFVKILELTGQDTADDLPDPKWPSNEELLAGMVGMAL
jgi:hypothetical protein